MRFFSWMGSSHTVATLWVFKALSRAKAQRLRDITDRWHHHAFWVNWPFTLYTTFQYVNLQFLYPFLKWNLWRCPHFTQTHFQFNQKAFMHATKIPTCHLFTAVATESTHALRLWEQKKPLCSLLCCCCTIHLSPHTAARLYYYYSPFFCHTFLAFSPALLNIFTNEKWQYTRKTHSSCLNGSKTVRTHTIYKTRTTLKPTNRPTKYKIWYPSRYDKKKREKTYYKKK